MKSILWVVRIAVLTCCLLSLSLEALANSAYRYYMLYKKSDTYTKIHGEEGGEKKERETTQEQYEFENKTDGSSKSIPKYYYEDTPKDDSSKNTVYPTNMDQGVEGN